MRDHDLIRRLEAVGCRVDDKASTVLRNALARARSEATAEAAAQVDRWASLSDDMRKRDTLREAAYQLRGDHGGEA